MMDNAAIIIKPGKVYKHRIGGAIYHRTHTQCTTKDEQVYYADVAIGIDV